MKRHGILGAHEARTSESFEANTAEARTTNPPLGWALLGLISLATVATHWISQQRDESADSRSLVSLPIFQLDVNTASAAQFAALPDVGEVLAGRIVEDRQQNGRFLQLEDLQRVRGFGAATLAKLRPLLTIVPTSESRPDQLAIQK